jgi:hypothetical protein
VPHIVQWLFFKGGGWGGREGGREKNRNGIASSERTHRPGGLIIL